MKKGLIIAMVLIVFGATASAKEVQVTISGMVCNFCAQSLTKAFKSQPGVTEVKVDMKTRVVTIDSRDDALLTKTQIEKIVKDAGYNVEQVKGL